MAENQSEQNSSNVQSLLLNAAIGFLSVLLIALLVALVTRLIYPRIFNERSEQQSQLISEIIQLEVLNGCGISGIANQYTSVLRSNGFDVVETGNFDHFNLEETIVICAEVSLSARRQKTVVPHVIASHYFCQWPIISYAVDVVAPEHL